MPQLEYSTEDILTEGKPGSNIVGINPSAPPAKQEEIKVKKEIVWALNLLQVSLHRKAQELQIFPR